eukprot:1000616-Prorocentrum_lima.AAC.1
MAAPSADVVSQNSGRRNALWVAPWGGGRASHSSSPCRSMLPILLAPPSAAPGSGGIGHGA